MANDYYLRFHDGDTYKYIYYNNSVIWSTELRI